jgi:hypothetical protein
VEGEEWLQEWQRHAISIWQGTGGSVDHGIDHGIAFGFFGFLGDSDGTWLEGKVSL